MANPTSTLRKLLGSQDIQDKASERSEEASQVALPGVRSVWVAAKAASALWQGGWWDMSWWEDDCPCRMQTDADEFIRSIPDRTGWRTPNLRIGYPLAICSLSANSLWSDPQAPIFASS
eukprot:483179-Amphidinium_carterae.1